MDELSSFYLHSRWYIIISSMKRFRAFTLVEITVTVAIIAILATIGMFVVPYLIEQARMGQANANTAKLAVALKDYSDEAGSYPWDSGPDPAFHVVVDGKTILIPPEVKDYLGGNVVDFKEGPWPGSWYDYESWDVTDGDGNFDPDDKFDEGGGKPEFETIQISIRFCDPGVYVYDVPEESLTCNYPNPYKDTFRPASAIYYCIKGYCRPSHLDEIGYPGVCLNCPNPEGVRTKDGK